MTGNSVEKICFVVLNVKLEVKLNLRKTLIARHFKFILLFVTCA